MTLQDAQGRPLAVDENIGRCSVCKTLRPKSEFYPDSHRSTGIKSTCKSCAYVKKRARLARLKAMQAELTEVMARYPGYVTSARKIIEGTFNAHRAA